MDQFQNESPGVGIGFDTHKFDTEFLKRNWIKVVIQEITGGRYWECEGLWTSDFEKATRFATCIAAAAHATHLNLSNAQLVLTRESKAYGAIPLRAGGNWSRSRRLS